MSKIDVNGVAVTVVKVGSEDYISLTDMMRSKDGEFFFHNWLRNRNTVEFLGTWEKVFNPEFNSAEFDIIKSKAGLNNFRLSAKEWRDANPELKGNIRDYATISQLICLSNMESLNAIFINEGLPQAERLRRLNAIAIQQMSVLEGNETNRNSLTVVQ